MEVWVDGEKNFKIDGDPQDVMAVFGAATSFLRERGRMPVEVQIDGVRVTPESLRPTLEGKALASCQKLELRSEDVRALVADCLRGIDEALAELPQACRQLAEIFQSDAPSEGFEPFQHIAEIWAHIKAHEYLAASAMDLDIDSAEIGGVTVAALSEQLNGFLEEAAQAIENNDAVLLGDLLEYELAPRAEQETAIVAWLQERAAALQQ